MVFSAVLVNEKNTNISQYIKMHVACLISSCLYFKCQFVIKCFLLSYEFLLLPFKTFTPLILYSDSLISNLTVAVFISVT